MTLGAFERKIIRGMCEQIEENGSYNNDIYSTYKDTGVVTYIKLGRLKWAGHICRMDGSRTPRKILE